MADGRASGRADVVPKARPASGEKGGYGTGRDETGHGAAEQNRQPTKGSADDGAKGKGRQSVVGWADGYLAGWLAGWSASELTGLRALGLTV